MQPIYAYDIFHPQPLSGMIPARNSHVFTDHMHAIIVLTVLTPVYITMSLFVFLIVTCKFTATC